MSLISFFISFFIIATSVDVSEIDAIVTFDKKQYYSVFESEDLNSINAEIKVLGTHANNSAYLGALFMKKAGIVGNPKDKLSFFKEGRIKLENAIKNNPNNIEFLFLRYMIQENAPGFIGYNTDLESDRKKIIAYYPNFDPIIQEAIRNYSKTSKTLSSVQF